MVPSRDRLKVVSGGSRAGSVPAGREGSVKAEDGDSDQVKGKKKGSSTASVRVRKGGARR
jgi:SAGA-associated factor 29